MIKKQQIVLFRWARCSCYDSSMRSIERASCKTKDNIRSLAFVSNGSHEHTRPVLYVLCEEKYGRWASYVLYEIPSLKIVNSIRLQDARSAGSFCVPCKGQTLYGTQQTSVVSWSTLTGEQVFSLPHTGLELASICLSDNEQHLISSAAVFRG